MSIIRQPYSAAKIGHIRQLLLNNAQAGKPVDYEIRVDDLKVLPRTNDPDHFDDHEDFVTEETQSVMVILYDGSSRRSTRHLFSMKQEEPKPEKDKGLSGIEVDRMVSDKIQQEKNRWQYELLEKDNQNLKKELSDAESYIEKIEQRLEEAMSKRKLGDMQWGEIASIAAESLLRRNTHLIAKIPGADGLAGVIHRDTLAQEGSSGLAGTKDEAEKEGEVSYSRVKAEPELTEEQKGYLSFLSQLEERFDAEEMQQVMHLLNLLAESPEHIPNVLSLLMENKNPVSNPPVSEEEEALKEPNY